MIDPSSFSRGGEDDSGGDDSGSTSTEQSGSSGSSSSSGTQSGEVSTEPYELTEDEKSDRRDEIEDQAEALADQGEPDYDAGASGSLEEYRRRQVKECGEMYDDFVSTMSGNMDEMTKSILTFEAYMLNLAQNRLGIYGILTDRFNMNEQKAWKVTRDICNEAGDKEAFEKVLTKWTKALSE